MKKVSIRSQYPLILELTLSNCLPSSSLFTFKRHATIFPTSPQQNNTERATTQAIVATPNVGPPTQQIRTTIPTYVQTHTPRHTHSSPITITQALSQLALADQVSSDDSSDDESILPPPPPETPHPEDAAALRTQKSISDFFSDLPKTDLKNFRIINQNFLDHCKLDDWDYDDTTAHAKAETEKAKHFINTYRTEIRKDISRTWEQQQSIYKFTIVQFLDNALPRYASQVTPKTPWAYLWVQDLFSLTKTEPINKESHIQLRLKIQICVLEALTSGTPPQDISYEDLLTEKQRPELVKTLQNAVFTALQNEGSDKTAPITSITQNYFRTFIEKLFHVSKAEIYHFNDFEFNKDTATN